jgi:hypothetical protein
VRNPQPLFVADFDACTGTNTLGGAMGATYNAPDSLKESFVPETDRGCVARIEYNIMAWAAFWMKTQGADLAPYSRLYFDICADPEPGIPGGIKLELKHGDEVSVQYVTGITADWQTLSVALADFGSAGYGASFASWQDLEELVFTFEANTSGRQGVVYLDNVIFASGNLPEVKNPLPSPLPRGEKTTRPISILVDDFSPQPSQGDQVYYFNRLDGDRGAINDSAMAWGRRQVTMTIAAGNTWGGGWLSLNHPMRESLPIDFSAILPAQILPAYQSQITGIMARIARGTPGKSLRLELKDHGALRWTGEIILDGGEQVINSDLPPLDNINELVWVLDDAAGGDAVVLDSITFTATTPITDTATRAFVWSYGQLLNNWNPKTGLVRDRGSDPSGRFDAIQATGSLAAATAQAAQLGVISQSNARQIVGKIGQTLLVGTPRFHGLWPHFVTVSPEGVIAIVPGTEWSSVDTVIAAIGLLTAQHALGLDTAATEQMLRDIDWADLILPDGAISMGYDDQGDRIPWGWKDFGTEAWLVQLASASAIGEKASMARPTPPTVNGSGFIDELAWLFVPPPASRDIWGVDWQAYRDAAADKQINFYPETDPTSCFAQLDLFGLSAGEMPDGTYLTLGVGGSDQPPETGAERLGAPAITPHYAGMIASLRPEAAIRMWDWLIANGLFTPLNNVESLLFPPGAPCDRSGAVWNSSKLSWNLALQTLGWGRYLAVRQELEPVLWRAATQNPLLRDGYCLLARCEPPW